MPGGVRPHGKAVGGIVLFEHEHRAPALTPALIRKLYRVETTLADTRGGSVLVPLTEGEK